jgi:hypothetical protein
MSLRVYPTHKLIVVAVCLTVGGSILLPAPGYRGPFPGLVNGYLIDLLPPFAMCLLLGIQDFEVLRRRTVRFVVVFGVECLTESLQYFGLPIFGRTFDPLDYLMFASGVGGAFVFEWTVLSRIRNEATP